MRKVWEEVKASLKIVVETIKQFYNRTKEESIQYKKDNKVWLEAINIITKYSIKKLNNKYLELFEILEKVGKSAYRLKLPSQ